jgi:hypothetical protein
MTEKNVVLDYACPHCHYPMNVTLKCAGRSVANGPHVAASVNIPCPRCEACSELYFEMSGQVLAIHPERRKPVPEPSRN